jgi:hypothetical protein
VIPVGAADPDGGAAWIASTLGAAIHLLALVPFAVLVGALRPALAEAGAAESRAHPWTSVLVGACVLLGVLGVAAATPEPARAGVAAALLAATSWLGVLGWCGEARHLGSVLARRDFDATDPAAGPTALGALLLALVPLLPVFGILAVALFGIRGVGARVRLLYR